MKSVKIFAEKEIEMREKKRPTESHRVKCTVSFPEIPAKQWDGKGKKQNRTLPLVFIVSFFSGFESERAPIGDARKSEPEMELHSSETHLDFLFLRNSCFR